jgi:hypothetical protein
MEGVKWIAAALCSIGLLCAQEGEGNFRIQIEPSAVLQTGVQIPVQIIVKDDRQKPLVQATVTLQVETLDHNRMHVYPAPATNLGTYLAKPVFPEAGEWSIYVEVHRGGKMTARTTQVSVPQ